MEIPLTEGVKYAGSKLRLLPAILKVAESIRANTILDGFSGTTRVSQAFARCNKTVIANDMAVWSEIFAKCYLLGKRRVDYYQEMIDHLNSVMPIDGWFTENYGGDPSSHHSYSEGKDGYKKPWQIKNTRKLDAIRSEIDRITDDDIDKAVLLTSLIHALDAVDNTLGHFASYLKKWSSRSYNDLVLKVPNLISNVEFHNHKVYRSNIFDLLDQVDVDLAYFDPPYGSNNDKMPPSRVRYSAYYHLWTTVCLNDQPATFGKARRRIDSSDRITSSVFEEFRKTEDGTFMALDALKQLINLTKARYILLSYSSLGRATAQDLKMIMQDSGVLEKVLEINYKQHVMSEMRWTNKWISDKYTPNVEFLFLLRKGCA
jgi:adenine-specific DNA-methyltransferase